MCGVFFAYFTFSRVWFSFHFAWFLHLISNLLFLLSDSLITSFFRVFHNFFFFSFAIQHQQRSPFKIYLFNLCAELINYTQPVYVWREDPNSRQNTIKEIQRRVTSGDDWQQILIFPEGTCTNRKGLITFKPGAFYPGVPVQPVCIRYPNRLDTLSWTWQGPGAYVTA